MTDAVQIALIAGVPPTIAALCGLGLGLLNHRQGKQIHVLVNKRMDEALKKIKTLEIALEISEDKNTNG